MSQRPPRYTRPSTLVPYSTLFRSELRHQGRGAVAGGAIQSLVTAGTVTTLAGVHKDLLRYDRAAVDGSYLDMATVRAISARITGMTYAERAAHPCIGPQRADLVIAGRAILSALCSLWPAQRLRVADRRLREGMLYAMIHGVSAPGGRWSSEPDAAVPAVAASARSQEH